MIATTSSTWKTKPENQNLNRSRSFGRKPKPVPPSEPEASADGSGRKPVEKPLPNYLRPTISSRPDPVKFSKKNNAVEDKLLRRRSFDRPPSSSTSPSTSPSQKYLNASSPPARPRDRAVVPREKPVTGLRSTSFHGSSRGGLRGSSTVASRGSPGVKKSGLSGASSSKGKKEGSENVQKRSSGKEIAAESSTLAPSHEDEEKIIKVETHVQGSDHREEDKDQVAQPEESVEGKDTGLMDASTEEEKGELINEDKTEEHKEPENTQGNNNMKEAADAEEEEEESESSKVKEGTTETEAQVKKLPEVSTKKEVGQGKKESPTAYNDVIASKMQERSRKNKVLALAGAFQTVIDYETAASK
ncbi:calmodulin-binding protein-related [Raphanus sativus]|nr:calmodulin-binding protein-related [Raphanus sativus]